MTDTRHKPILVIEDDPGTLEAVTLSLELQGFQVYGATEGQQALDVLGTIEVPGLILMDLSMAGMDGIQFRKRQQEDPRLSGIHVVVMSGAADIESRIPPQANVSYLHKPISLEQLLEVAKRYCA